MIGVHDILELAHRFENKISNYHDDETAVEENLDGIVEITGHAYKR